MSGRACPRCGNPLGKGSAICWQPGCLVLCVEKIPKKTFPWIRASCVWCRSRIPPAWGNPQPRKWCVNEACMKRRAGIMSTINDRKRRQADPQAYYAAKRRKENAYYARMKVEQPEWHERRLAYNRKHHDELLADPVEHAKLRSSWLRSSHKRRRDWTVYP